MHQNALVRYVMPFEAVVMTAVLVPVMATTGGTTRWVLLGVLLGFGFALPALILRWTMTTVVTSDALLVRFWPLPGKTLLLGDIRSVEAVAYNPWEAGGWGYRRSRKHHRIWNVSGGHGVRLRWGEADDEQCLIGSREPELLAEAIVMARDA